jgi:hypothetical protein
MIRVLRSHPVAAASGAAAFLGALAWLAFGFFGVHTLFIDAQVSEAAPVFDAPAAALADPAATAAPAPSVSAPSVSAPSVSAPSVSAPSVSAPSVSAPSVSAPSVSAPPATAPAAGEIVTEFAGEFRTIDKETTGRALVLGNGTGQRFLRFEEFSTGNGPDLDVWLVNSSTGDMSDYIDLGELKGNIGEQNYEIPDGVDLTVYDTVVIWCVRFSSGFGEATLEPMI